MRLGPWDGCRVPATGDGGQKHLMSGNATNQELADQLSSGQGWPNL
jgi:hypothetical protein